MLLFYIPYGFSHLKNAVVHYALSCTFLINYTILIIAQLLSHYGFH